jgi:hypothetical protein
MYWCKSKVSAGTVLMLGLLLVFCLPACKPDVKETGAALAYFDVKGYFEKDSSVLQKKNWPVAKTVIHNGISESKTVHIADWGKELNFFIASDINKPAWRNSYLVVNNNDFITYTAKTPDLEMRHMVIKKSKEKGNIEYIVIFNKTENILYQTAEKLTYYPDSLYQIEKRQHVRLMGNNYYKIVGKIKK